MCCCCENNNNYISRKFALFGLLPGRYTFTLSLTDCDVLATGDVMITEKTVEENMPEKPKVDGTTVEKLFNKFKPQN